MDISLLGVDPEWLRAAGIFGAFVLAAVLVAIIWRRLIGRWAAKTESTLDDVIARGLKRIVIWALLLAGAHYAVTEIGTVRNNTVVWPILGRSFTIAWILVAIGTAIGILNGVSKWRIEQAEELNTEKLRDITTRVAFTRKLINVVIAIIGGLYILSVTGVDTSPILAGGDAAFQTGFGRKGAWTGDLRLTDGKKAGMILCWR